MIASAAEIESAIAAGHPPAADRRRPDGRVLEPDRRRASRGTAIPRPGPARRSPGARPGGRAGTDAFSSRPGRTSGPAVGRPEREAADLRRARPSRRSMTTPSTASVPGGGSRGRPPSRTARRRAGHRDDPTRASTKSPSPPVHGVRRGSRCSPARRAACRRRSADTSPRRARRSAGRAPRASGAGRPGRSSARSASRGRRSGPPGRRSSTISPPSASTAGSIASSEPPVVRMSSTSRTRSPGSIWKPRRNSRRVAPSSSRTSSAKMRSNAELAAGLEGEDDAAGRRPGDEVHERRAVASRRPGRPEAAQLAGRRRVLEDRELLEVARRRGGRS